MPALAQLRRTMEDALQRLPGERIVWRGPASVKRVALTFDDGPDERTPRYLELLERYGVAATFFVMGDLTEARRDAINEYLRRGHQVGSHGHDHQRFTSLSVRALRDQLARAEAAIGPVPQGRLWVRPPYGAMGPREAAMMLARGHVIGMWSLDSKDYEEAPPEAIAERCAPGVVQPGDVLLFHEGNDWTLAALPLVIERLLGDGFELVTMADLVAT
ncbi:MAG: polysaccharide deacetylase family protein [Deltaproteobacteria bacterium]|nr:polysaccharide deacetylase family protein [Kofleriaceae bacterium]